MVRTRIGERPASTSAGLGPQPAPLPPAPPTQHLPPPPGGPWWHIEASVEQCAWGPGARGPGLCLRSRYSGSLTFWGRGSLKVVFQVNDLTFEGKCQRRRRIMGILRLRARVCACMRACVCVCVQCNFFMKSQLISILVNYFVVVLVG